MNPHPLASDDVRPDPHVIVIFGGTGDLAHRKIFPGLFHLYLANLLPERFRIIGVVRPPAKGSNDDFRARVRDAIVEFGDAKPDGEEWEAFIAAVSAVAADATHPATLMDAVESAERELGEGARRLYHLAVPPDATLQLITMLGTTGLNANARVICEKPFGTDLASAKVLNETIRANFDETQVFRIDHFLGKESIDNILALRFANRLFEPLWNRDHICFVQIDVPESLTVAGRGAFYEETGAFRDMVVSHLFQVMGYLAMEQPTSFDAGPLRDEIHKVFQTMRPLDVDNVVRGQYQGYRDEPGVAPDSTVETFVALRVEIENTRWKGVPFYLRTGKGMAQRRQVITIGFEEPVMRLFPLAKDAQTWRGNRLVVDFDDPGSIHAHFLAKEPGPVMQLGEATMSFYYKDSFRHAHRLEAYEHLILEAMLGNRALFTRSDGIERLWEVAAPLLEVAPEVEFYAQGSWGPTSMERIVAPHGWCLP
ncbi:MAG: glucose-6-phosphate dehydrogenase [Acidobacteriota bacterium]|nr:glucose-6-phosphate dehydrogenase [Acidobacteriota bacterium]MDE3107972.1 glucose-6-phosphate dehydrogenase [Acidobacteriota bacterium]